MEVTTVCGKKRGRHNQWTNSKLVVFEGNLGASRVFFQEIQKTEGLGTTLGSEWGNPENMGIILI